MLEFILLNVLLTQLPTAERQFIDLKNRLEKAGF